MKDCLIVDDSRVIRMAIKRIMQEFDFNISEAEDGEKALEACNENMPDVIMLDWNMPVMSGIEFLQELRKLDGGEEPKVIFCTTENDFGFIQKALEQGADEYIMKPFDRDIIQTKLEQVGIL